MSAEFDPDPFTDALREDLPSREDEARVRTRLAAAGVLVGVGVVAPGATAAAAGAATPGVFAKMLALPLAAKLGATAVFACVVSVPVVRARMHRAEPSAVASKRAPGRANAATPAVPTKPAANVAQTPVAAAESPPVELPAPAVGVTAPGGGRSSRARSRDAAPAPVPAANAASARLPAVGSFPVATAPVDEGTLRAETALMEQALGAIKRGDLASAKQKLAEHARTFPNGHLAPERERALERVREKETSQ